MSGSVEVRQFLLRYEGEGQGAGLGGVPAQRAGQADAPRVSDDQVRRARLAVARGARGIEDCAQLLDMLGLKPDDDGNAPVQR
ncbi:hypothetical protein DI005_32245 [Prauserella sp. PE36]|uniref:Uncharacterized protein n=1 Tax=Prauserella endophytica TaxID=1592324 RepID=A0ABY2RW53_9PSEU|nr:MULTISPECIES: hypothetical protein [Prauserella]PXY34441.1 hypothetical protein BAY59_02645 [Prauserella coralliicola]RBM13094.1 hypothetical protein DI005_32245 [Prauserella sp. PE36]TKG62884.1 hypothetical protein FCN18_31245 [Prauserella endophytica]